MDKFLLAENPMAGHALAIVHMLQPVSIITVHEGHLATKFPYKHYTFTNADGGQEQHTLSLYHCFTNLVATDEDNDKMIAKLLRDAWHWYMAYLNWEDENIANEEGQ